MQEYIGNKRIKAERMERDGEPGYKVIYQDGYESWSPKEVFEEAYLPVNKLTFSEALEQLKRGKKVARKGWNGKNMWLKLIPGGNAVYCGYDMQDCIGMKTADNVMQPGWLASQADLLADDWCVID